MIDRTSEVHKSTLISENGVVLYLWVEINDNLYALPRGKEVYKRELGRTSLANVFNISSEGWHNLWCQRILVATFVQVY